MVTCEFNKNIYHVSLNNNVFQMAKDTLGR